MITDYFMNLEETVQKYSSIFTNFSSDMKVYDSSEGFITGVIDFTNGSILDFAELKNTEIEAKKKYRYHYMSEDKNLIFRYDNSKHHKEIATFPHHKHTPDGIEESEEPTIESIMTEIVKIITSS